MKLYEISPESFKTKPTPGGDSNNYQHHLKGTADEVGSGVEANVYQKDEPGVRRIQTGIEFPEHSGHLAFMKMIAKNDRFKKNPFFPNIYDIELRKGGYHGRDDEISYHVDMEELHEFKQLSNKEAMFIGKKLFHKFERLIRKGSSENVSGFIDPSEIPMRIYLFDLIEELLATSSRDGHTNASGELFQMIKDPKFKEAIMLIRKMFNSYGNDVHEGNIMVRRSPHGPQLVFTDVVGSV